MVVMEIYGMPLTAAGQMRERIYELLAGESCPLIICAVLSDAKDGQGRSKPYLRITDEDEFRPQRWAGGLLKNLGLGILHGVTGRYFPRQAYVCLHCDTAGLHDCSNNKQMQDEPKCFCPHCRDWTKPIS